jgi:hypothetical protein
LRQGRVVNKVCGQICPFQHGLKGACSIKSVSAWQKEVWSKKQVSAWLEKGVVKKDHFSTAGYRRGQYSKFQHGWKGSVVKMSIKAWLDWGVVNKVSFSMA